MTTKALASTDVVEITSVLTPYPDIDTASPFIWFDVPGLGTLACPDWTYFNDQGLYVFDAIIQRLLYGHRPCNPSELCTPYPCLHSSSVQKGGKLVGKLGSLTHRTAPGIERWSHAVFTRKASMKRERKNSHGAGMFDPIMNAASAVPPSIAVMSVIVPRSLFSVTMFQVPAFQSRAFDALGFRFYTCAKRARLEAERIQQLQNEANQAHIEQLQKENQEQADIARRAKLDTEKAAKIVGELQDQAKQKDEEVKNVQAARDEMEAKWKKGIRPVEWPSQEQYEKIKQQYYKEGKFHLAIAGISGTGKSTLTNAFRGIRDGEEKAAATDIVESTSIVTAYPDPNSSNPFLWFDVPGSGTFSCSDWTRFNNPGLMPSGTISPPISFAPYPTYTSEISFRRHGGCLALGKVVDDARKDYTTKTRDSVRTNLMKNDPPLRSQREPLEDVLVLDEHELWKGILQDAFSRRSEKSYDSMAELMKKTGSGLSGLFS
ncbi:hypothetical protein EDD85DRAFT_797688 [Armillaria nabsnona]|nr:hypothetical protein EDD85DRAFT_797688 [Armillaria nabsnona]